MDSLTPEKSLSVRRMRRLTVLVSALCFGLTSFVLAPVYLHFAPDILYADTWWVNLLYYLTEEGLLDLVAFAVCYPAAIYAVWRAGFKGALKVPVAFALMTLGKFVVNYFMTSIVDGALPGISEFLSFDLPYIGVMYLLEMAQYAAVIFLALRIKARHERRLAEAELTGNGGVTAASFTFDRLLSLKNPVQRAAFFSAILLFAVRVVMHQIYQYTLYVTSGYTDGVVAMVLELFADLFVGVIVYFAALLLLARFARKDAETAAETAAAAAADTATAA